MSRARLRPDIISAVCYSWLHGRIPLKWLGMQIADQKNYASLLIASNVLAWLGKMWCPDFKKTQNTGIDNIILAAYWNIFDEEIFTGGYYFSYLRILEIWNGPKYKVFSQTLILASLRASKQ